MNEDEYLRQASESFDNFLKSKELNEAIERNKNWYIEGQIRLYGLGAWRRYAESP